MRQSSPGDGIQLFAAAAPGSVAPPVLCSFGEKAAYDVLNLAAAMASLKLVPEVGKSMLEEAAKKASEALSKAVGMDINIK